MKASFKKRLLIILGIGIFIGVFLFLLYDHPKASKLKKNSSDLTSSTSVKVSTYTLPNVVIGGTKTSSESEKDSVETTPATETKDSLTPEKSQSTTSKTASHKTNKSDFAGIVNINTAEINELQQLKGVGPVMAQRIIDYRETHGGFNSVEEIMQVKGIAEKRFADIKDKICI